MELSKLMSDLTQHKSLLVIGALVVLYLAIVFLERYSKGKKGNVLGFLRRLKGETPQLKGNILYVDVGGQKLFRFKIASGTVLLTLLGLALFKSPSILFESLFFLPLILAGIGIYVELVPTPGIYKNGKYLGTVHAGIIKVGDGVALGKRQDTATIGSLEILRDGGLVAELHLTAEGFMELKPDKISEVFPQIKGKVERFGRLFKIGEYTLEYSFFKRNTNISYQEVANTRR